MNLSLDDFDDDYIERASSITCPNCRSYSRLSTLLARFENDHLRLSFRAVPKPVPVILYLDRRATDQPKTFTWIKKWLKQKDQAGVTQLEEIIPQKADRERDIYNVYDELRELIDEWRFFKQLRLDQLEEKARRARARRRPKP